MNPHLTDSHATGQRNIYNKPFLLIPTCKLKCGLPFYLIPCNQFENNKLSQRDRILPETFLECIHNVTFSPEKKMKKSMEKFTISLGEFYRVFF